MSRKVQRESARAERLEAMRAEQRKRARRRTALIVAACLVVVGVLGGVAWALFGSSGSEPAKAGKVALTGLQKYPGLARDHTTGKVLYEQTPPVGGKHSAVWQNCGIYDKPVKNENAVHSLEHGAIWITYRPGLAASQIATIRDDVAGQRYGLVSPYPGLPAPVVATVWGQQLKLGSASDPRLKVFVDTFKSGSQSPEPGAECAGGIGVPLP